MRVFKTAVAAVATLAAITGTSVVAFAYPEPNGHETIRCQPGTVDAHNGNCSVIFTDKDKNDKPRYGQQICFTVSGPGSVQPTCAATDRKGVARATYYTGAYPGDCANANKNGKTSATITGTENEGGATGSAQTTVQIKCKQTKGGGDGDNDGDDHGQGRGGDGDNDADDHGQGGGGGDHGNGNGGDHGNGDSGHGNDNGHGNGDGGNGRRYDTSAAVVLTDNSGVGGTMAGVGIVAVMIMLAVAVTGRLRLRRLRR